jgi:hypothetical protein
MPLPISLGEESLSLFLIILLCHLQCCPGSFFSLLLVFLFLLQLFLYGTSTAHQIDTFYWPSFVVLDGAILASRRPKMQLIKAGKEQFPLAVARL